MRAVPAAMALALAGCAGAPSLEQQRLASPVPQIASCAQWFQALDREVAAAGVRDLQYAAVPGFPYLRADAFLAASRALAAASPAAFEAFADRLLEHDLESRRNEIENLPPWTVEKWSGMGLDDSRALALKRSMQCGLVLRADELVRTEWRSALLASMRDEPVRPPHRACRESPRGTGARVRFAPPRAAVSRATVAGWLRRGEHDPLAQPVISARELDDMAPLYAPSFELVIASDGDRFGALRWRRGVAGPQVDPAEPTIYVARSYTRAGEGALLQISYTVLFPRNRITWRVTLAPDGSPLAYDALGGDGCYLAILRPRAREGERPLVAIAAGSHGLRSAGLVQGSDSLARYALRPYGELRSAPTLEGRNRAAVGGPALAGVPLHPEDAAEAPR